MRAAAARAAASAALPTSPRAYTIRPTSIPTAVNKDQTGQDQGKEDGCLTAFSSVSWLPAFLPESGFRRDGRKRGQAKGAPARYDHREMGRDADLHG